MEKDSYDKLFELARSAKLSEQERKVLLRDITTRTLKAKTRLSTSRSPIYILFTPLRTPAFALLTLFVLTGGVAAAAEGALPGDILYPVKVGVNEQVARVARVSDEAKAVFETNLASRRLAEAEALAERDALSEEVQGEIAERFAAQAKVVEATIEVVRQKNPVAAKKLRENFEASLKKHEESLLGEAPGVAFATSEISDMVAEDSKSEGAADVRGGKEEEEVSQLKNEEPEGVTAKDKKANGKIKLATTVARTSAEQKISEVKNRLGRLQNTAVFKENSSPQNALVTVERLLHEGDLLVEEGLYREARARFQEVKEEVRSILQELPEEKSPEEEYNERERESDQRSQNDDRDRKNEKDD